jgi:hypothetical protein
MKKVEKKYEGKIQFDYLNSCFIDKKIFLN